MTIRVVVVDDQAVVRAGFRLILEAEHDIEVVSDAADGEHGVRVARRLRPDLVLMDVRMPRVDGLAATRQLAGPHVENPIDVLVVTTFDLDEYVFGALRAGASGFLLKDVEPAELVTAVRVVARGDGLVMPAVTRRLIAEFARAALPAHPGDSVELARLTDREREILTLVARGLSNSEIAEHRSVGTATVKTHVRSILTKLELRDRVQAVVFAYEHGVVQPGTEFER